MSEHRLWERLAAGTLAVFVWLLAPGVGTAQAQAPTPPPAGPPELPPPASPTRDLPAVGSGLYPVESRYYSGPPEPEAQIDRRGLVVQVGLGAGGVFDEEDGSFGVGYDIGVGGALNRNFAVLFNYSSLTIGLGEGQRATHAIFGGALQLFLGQRVWLKLGAGLGQLTVANSWGFTLDATERAFAGMLGLGIEVYQLSPNFALDLQLRTAGGNYQDAGMIVNGAVMLGLNWY